MTDAERAIARLRAQAVALRQCFGPVAPPHINARIAEKLRTAKVLERALGVEGSA